MAKTLLLSHLRRLLRTAEKLQQNPNLSLEQLEQRRNFLLQGARLSLLALPITPLLSACASGGKFKNPDDPVIILGGGISGLTAAFYLAKAGIASHIYEASARVGGRMMTKTQFNSQAMFCELGGEFVDSHHKDIMDLCQFFGIAMDPLETEDQGLATNLYYFKNNNSKDRKYFLDRDAIKMLQVFNKKYQADYARVQTDEGAKYFDQMTLEKYLDGYRSSVDTWFLEMLRIAYVGEMGLEASEQSALLLVGTLSPSTENGFRVYGDSDQALRIRGGNQALISNLEKWLLNHGVQIHKNLGLKSISENGSRLQMSFHNHKGVVQASKVICTIPFTVLRQIESVMALPITELRKAHIREMSYATNSKIIQGYSARIWRTGITESKQFVPPSNGMVYTDLFSQNIWETSRAQLGSFGILTNYLGGNDGANLVAADGYEKCLSVVDQIFPGTRKLAQSERTSMNWSKNPFNLGSYGSARPNEISKFASLGRQSELGGKLLFAGEHVAPKFSGYMNGACLSGRLIAESVTATI